jgi:FdhE protein
LLALIDALRNATPLRISLPPGYLAAKLKRGVPALTAERIPIPVAVLGPSLIAFCGDLAEGGAGEPAAHLARVLSEGRIDAGSILAASLGRHQQAIRAGAVAHDLSPDLLWLVAELSASPLAHSLQSQYLAVSHDARLTEALDTWSHGYCPSCGSWPALAETIESRRMLRCSFCALAWSPHADGCVYCGTSGEAFVSFTPDESQPELRVDVCGGCHAYLKTVVVADWSPFPLLAISDLESAAIDAEMMARGFTRPPLKDFTHRA